MSDLVRNTKCRFSQGATQIDCVSLVYALFLEIDFLVKKKDQSAMKK